MSRNNIIVIIVAVILIIVCIIAGNNKNNETDIVSETGEEKRQVAFDTTTNETTGADEYVVYDQATGEEITRVEDEHQLKIYELDPNYEELPVDEQEEVQNLEDTVIE